MVGEHSGGTCVVVLMVGKDRSNISNLVEKEREKTTTTKCSEKLEYLTQKVTKLQLRRRRERSGLLPPTLPSLLVMIYDGLSILKIVKRVT